MAGDEHADALAPTHLLPEILRTVDWQMSLGERAALEGILSQLKPRLSVEIGTAEGGSLQRIATHSTEVHSFDLVAPAESASRLSNVVFHQGDSHAFLPQVLAEFSEEDRNVDFVLVDGDHSAEGVRRDIDHILNSPAVRHSVILIHDTMNETVRKGLEEVEFEAWPKVAYVELDFVAGYMFREEGLRGELWGGLGLVITDAGRSAVGQRARQRRYVDAFELVMRARPFVLEEFIPLDQTAPQQIRGQLLDQFRAENARLRDELSSLGDRYVELADSWNVVINSNSWRRTAPLRRVAKRLRRLMA